MALFDEQIKKNKKNKQDNLESAFMMLSEAVSGNSIYDSIDKNDIAKGAISLLCKFYHIPVSDESYPRDVDTFEKQLEYRLKPHGIKYRKIALREDWYKNATAPLLSTLKDSGDVVLLVPNKFDRYYYYDLKNGEKVKVTKKTIQNISDEATYFYRPFGSAKMTNMDLFKFVFSCFSTFDVLKVVLSSLFVIILGLFLPKFSQLLFADILESKSISMLLGMAVMMVGVSIATACISLVKVLVYEKLERKATFVVEASAMMRVLSLPTTFFKKYSSGDLAYKLSCIKDAASLILSIIFDGGVMFIFSLLYFVSVGTIASQLLGPAIIITIVTCFLTVLISFSTTRNTKKIMEEDSKENGLTYMIMSGVEKIKLTGSEERAYNRWARQYANSTRATYSPGLFLTFSSTIIFAVDLLASVIYFYLAVKYEISSADYYGFLIALGLIDGAISSVSTILNGYSSLKPTLEMIEPILSEEPEVSGSKQIVNRLNGNIELSNVSFKYEENGPTIVDNLSCRIRNGEYVAIVGKTGCGKSTLIRLLLGFEKPSKGSIYFDGKDLTKLDLESLRKKIGIVTQDGDLIDDDIYHNIVASCPSLGMDEAWEAAEIAGIANDIEEMPMGMQTMISENGGGISGGQKQRILIARAIVSKPKVLIFDEATSALDNVTQKQVSDALNELECTRIVVAHRLSTIKNCSRILVLDHGKIIEEGTYEQLIKENGFFAELVKNQRLDINDGK